MKKKDIDCSYIRMANNHTTYVKQLQMMKKRDKKRKILFITEMICYAVASMSMLFREDYILGTVVICAVTLPLGVILDIVRCRQ